MIDAWRVESTNADQLSPGASMIQAGYRIGMLVSGAGSLLIADYAGWFAAYATMAALVAAGLVVFLLAPEPKVPAETSRAVESGWHAVRHALSRAVISPFRDFMQRPLWPVILVAIFGYKLGEAMAGVMSTPLSVSLRFILPEIAAASKVFGFFSIVGGVLLGGVVTTRYGILRSLILCGILQSAGNLFFVLQAVGGHRIGYLALCVTAENITGGMAGTALITYISSLCSPAFTATATQYALLSSITLLGRTVVASSGGWLSEKMGWPWFFVIRRASWDCRHFFFSPWSHGVTISTRESSLSIARRPSRKIRSHLRSVTGRRISMRNFAAVVPAENKNVRRAGLLSSTQEKNTATRARAWGLSGDESFCGGEFLRLLRWRGSPAAQRS